MDSESPLQPFSPVGKGWLPGAASCVWPAFYACTIFLSAFLLFAVQPMIAKAILPWFGGSAAVWITCLMFFQAALLLGYLYVHWVVRHLTLKIQASVHLVLLGVSLCLLPIAPRPPVHAIDRGDPVFGIVGLLSLSVGLPYVLLSMTSPLIQAWYAETRKVVAPYRLYALSNLGSMLALLTYPAILEPFIGTHRQLLWWSMGYAGFVALCASLALAAQTGNPLTGRPVTHGWNCETEKKAPGWTLYVRWGLLPACASALLLAITAHLTQNIAPIPLLWVLPLSLYLLSFIVCFDRAAWYPPRIFRWLLAIVLGGLGYTILRETPSPNLRLSIAVFSTGLFICCMFCHGELARLKPYPSHLTAFYLMISIGGTLGAVLVSVAAPRLFSSYLELPIGLLACALLGFFCAYRDSWLAEVAWVVLTVLLVFVTLTQALLLPSRSRVLARNFYGTLRVQDDGQGRDTCRVLYHGTIIHGAEYLAPDRILEPVTYYGPHSGIGLALTHHRNSPQRVGVVGLGAGTLAAYARAGDSYRFYEINPMVIQLARTEFHFLGSSAASVEIAPGDGRLSLENEADQRFDVLALDAFAGDSVPVHLLTREAFHLYFQRLKPAGLLAVHVTNSYLNLSPVVARLAESLGKQYLFIEDQGDSKENRFASSWILVAGDHESLNRPEFTSAAKPIRSGRDPGLWSDDYSNLVRILQ